MPSSRPYRSHLRPACLACRKRKSRCKTDSAETAACLMCRFHDTDCCFPGDADGRTRDSRSPRTEAQMPRTRSSRPATRSSREPTTPSSSSPRQVRHRDDRRRQARGAPRAISAIVAAPSVAPPETPFPSPLSPTPPGHVVGPVLSPDTQLIANYLPSRPDARTSRNVMFSAVRSRPLGTSPTQTTASIKCQTIEKLVEPFCSDLVDLYFEKVHRCFPLLDEAAFRAQYASSCQKQISPALLACLYAHALVFWRHSPVLARHRCPDVRFVWNQASDALHSELHLAPALDTVVAILLNISGRPLTSIVGNGLLLGCAVSLAHSLGLNRDCQAWDLSPADKALRTRVWWAIVIYDKWSSVAYGTPPHLQRTQHDTPSLTATHLYGPSTAGPVDPDGPAAVFVGLATLTDVLDYYLSHVFCLRGTSTEQPNIEGRLAQWEDSLPGPLRKAVIRGVNLGVPGSPNLRLAYLYLKLLSRKLELDGATALAPRVARHTPVRRAAEDVVLLVEELDAAALADFWLPLAAFSLASTTATLLRCALEEAEADNSGGPVSQSIPLRLARDMVAALRSHRAAAAWDLGDICIAQYAAAVDRLSSPSTSSEPPARPPSAVLPGLDDFLASNVPGVQELFPDLWDMFSGT